MIKFSWQRIVIPLCLSLLLFVNGCADKPSSYDQVQQETTDRGAAPAVAKDAEQGSSFNKFFPKSGDGYKVIPAQEKKGFAEYKIDKDGKNVAMLAISDTSSNPAAAAKFKSSTTKVGGYPSVEQGSNGTAILVNDRYQVKVLSRDPSFTREDRVKWLAKFNLRGLAQLQASLTPRESPKVVPATKPKPVAVPLALI